MCCRELSSSWFAGRRALAPARPRVCVLSRALHATLLTSARPTLIHHGGSDAPLATARGDAVPAAPRPDPVAADCRRGGGRGGRTGLSRERERRDARVFPAHHDLPPLLNPCAPLRGARRAEARRARGVPRSRVLTRFILFPLRVQEELEQLPQSFVPIDELQLAGVSATDIKVRAPASDAGSRAGARLIHHPPPLPLTTESQGGGVRHRQVAPDRAEEVPHRGQGSVRREGREDARSRHENPPRRPVRVLRHRLRVPRDGASTRPATRTAVRTAVRRLARLSASRTASSIAPLTHLDGPTHSSRRSARIPSTSRPARTPSTPSSEAAFPRAASPRSTANGGAARPRSATRWR